MGGRQITQPRVSSWRLATEEAVQGTGTIARSRKQGVRLSASTGLWAAACSAQCGGAVAEWWVRTTGVG